MISATAGAQAAKTRPAKASGKAPSPSQTRAESAIATPSLGKPKIAVLDVQTTGVREQFMSLLTEIVASHVQDTNQYEVITGRELNVALGVDSQSSLISCTDASCLVQVGGAVGARYIVASHVGRMANTFVVHVKLIDVENVRTARRIYETVSGDEDVVLQALKTLVPRLFGADGANSTPSQVPVPTASSAPNQTPNIVVSASEPSTTSFGAVGTTTLSLWSAAVIAAGVGTYFGLATTSHYRNFIDRSLSSNTREDHRVVGQQSQTIANVSWGVAAVALVAGIGTWWWSSDSADAAQTDSENSSATSIVPVVAPGRAGVVVSF